MAEDGATADLWVATRAALAVDDRISPAMQGFLDLAEVQGAIGDSIYLEVPNDLARSMLDQRIRPIIEELLRSNPDNQEIYNFRVTTNPDIEPVFGSTGNTVGAEFDEATSIGSASSPEPARTPNSSGFETRLNPKYTFDNFVMGSTNILARSAAFAVADKPAGAGGLSNPRNAPLAAHPSHAQSEGSLRMGPNAEDR